MRRAQNTWQGFERRVADWLAPGLGRRTPLSGGNSGHTRGDVIGVPGIYAEVKYRKSHATVQLLAETRQQAKAEGLLPVVVLTQERHQGFALVIHSDDFEAAARQILKNRVEAEILKMETDNDD